MSYLTRALPGSTSFRTLRRRHPRWFESYFDRRRRRRNSQQVIIVRTITTTTRHHYLP